MAGVISYKASKVGLNLKMIPNTYIFIHFWPFSENQISVSTIEETKTYIMNKNPLTLYVTTASTYKTQTLNETITFVTKNFENRKKSERDIWLFGLDNSEGWDLFKTRNMLEVF